MLRTSWVHWLERIERHTIYHAQTDVILYLCKIREMGTGLATELVQPDRLDECCICYDRLGCNYMDMQCGHKLHPMCLAQCLAQCNACPLCRAPHVIPQGASGSCFLLLLKWMRYADIVDRSLHRMLANLECYIDENMVREPVTCWLFFSCASRRLIPHPAKKRTFVDLLERILCIAAAQEYSLRKIGMQLIACAPIVQCADIGDYITKLWFVQACKSPNGEFMQQMQRIA